MLFHRPCKGRKLPPHAGNDVWLSGLHLHQHRLVCSQVLQIPGCQAIQDYTESGYGYMSWPRDAIRPINDLSLGPLLLGIPPRLSLKNSQGGIQPCLALLFATYKFLVFLGTLTFQMLQTWPLSCLWLARFLLQLCAPIPILVRSKVVLPCCSTFNKLSLHHDRCPPNPR